MKNFVVYRIACTLQLLFFFLVGCLVYNPENYCGDEGFFYLPVSALVTIVILNDGTIISVAFDNVESSKDPEEWNMIVLSLISSVIGFVALVSSLLLLDWGMQCSGNYENRNYLNSIAANKTAMAEHMPNGTAPIGAVCTYSATNFLTWTGMDSAFGMDSLHYEQVKTMMYLKIALSDYLSLFNSRCQGWFFTRAPSWHVVFAAIFSTICSSMLAHWWPLGSDMTGIPGSVVAFVWLYTIVWGFIQDSCKVLAYFLLSRGQYIKVHEAIDQEKFRKQVEAGQRNSKRRSDEMREASIDVKTFLPN